MTKQTIYKIDSMKGLGDNIYQRAFIKTLSKENYFILDSPFPEIYQDLKTVYFENCKTELRTQKKNVKKTDYCGRRADDLTEIIKRQSTRLINLGKMCYTNKGIINGMRERFKCEPEQMDLPIFEPSQRIAEIVKQKYALIRPITERKEWHSSARNPKPEYLFEAVEILKNKGFLIVSVADVDGVNEKFVGDKPVCDVEFNAGELGICEILCLTQKAEVVVGGIGWAIPAAMAYNVNAVFICGGWGEFNHPDRLSQNTKQENIKFIMPDNFCMCRDSYHDCNKTITNFKEKFIQSIGVL